MPIHALLGHLVIITAPMSALLALIYAWLPGTRPGLRLPLVLASLLNVVLATWAELAGDALIHRLMDAAKAANQELTPTAMKHADQADALTVSSYLLLVAVLTFVWWLLAPRRQRGTGTLVAAVLLTLCVLAVGWFSTTTLVEALRAVWSQHTIWSG